MRTMRLLFLLTLLLTTVSIHAQTLPLEQRAFILSKTYASIPLHFAHWKGASFKPKELDSVYQIYLKRGLATENRREFALIMREFVALLHNGHSWYNDSKVVGAMLPMGVSLIVINQEWIVSRSFVEGVAVGDRVLRLNGKLMEDHFKEQSKYSAVSDLRASESRLIWALAMNLPETYLLEVEKKSGATSQLIVDRSKLKPTPQNLRTESHWLDQDRVAYLKVPSFNKPEFEKSALEQLKQFQSAQAIIVDVRANGGGSTPSRLTAALMNKPYRWWTEGTPVTFGLFRYYSEARPSIELNEYFHNAQLTWQSEEIIPPSDGYAGKVIILVDRNTGSAAEDFVVPFKDNGRALILGEATNGSTGQPYMYNFGDGISVGIGTKRAYLPDGGDFEGIGIRPDVQIILTRSDCYDGKDRVLERALEEALKAH